MFLIFFLKFLLKFLVFKFFWIFFFTFAIFLCTIFDSLLCFLLQFNFFLFKWKIHFSPRENISVGYLVYPRTNRNENFTETSVHVGLTLWNENQIKMNFKSKDLFISLSTSSCYCSRKVPEPAKKHTKLWKNTLGTKLYTVQLSKLWCASKQRGAVIIIK